MSSRYKRKKGSRTIPNTYDESKELVWPGFRELEGSDEEPSKSFRIEESDNNDNVDQRFTSIQTSSIEQTSIPPPLTYNRNKWRHTIEKIIIKDRSCELLYRIHQDIKHMTKKDLILLQRYITAQIEVTNQIEVTP